mgnify:FL=1
MTQNAVVTKLISRHVAEVEVERGTACGGTCESCEACVFQSRIRAEALNKVSALPGQKVVIESKTSDVLGAAALLSRSTYDIGTVSWVASMISGSLITIPVLFFGGVILALR